MSLFFPTNTASATNDEHASMSAQVGDWQSRLKWFRLFVRAMLALGFHQKLGDVMIAGERVLCGSSAAALKGLGLRIIHDWVGTAGVTSSKTHAGASPVGMK